jgi:hypothetical protein
MISKGDLVDFSIIFPDNHLDFRSYYGKHMLFHLKMGFF